MNPTPSSADAPEYRCGAEDGGHVCHRTWGHYGPHACSPNPPPNECDWSWPDDIRATSACPHFADVEAYPGICCWCGNDPERCGAPPLPPGRTEFFAGCGRPSQYDDAVPCGEEVAGEDGPFIAVCSSCAAVLLDADPEEATTMKVKCHGCGLKYDPTDLIESTRHTRHGGDTGMPRERLLDIINECQAERDEALRHPGAMAALEECDGPERTA